jgi:hypothetical protein
VNSPLKLTVTTGAEGEPSGFDSAITTVPARLWHVTAAGERILLLSVARRELRELSERLAAGGSERLHHADWVITADPDEVAALGMMHDCATCRAGVDQALARMREEPGTDMAVGQLWWARR